MRLFLIAVLVLATLPAPEADARPLEAIIWGGGVQSQTFGADGDALGDQRRSGGTVGMGFLWKKGRHLGFMLDARYTQKGTRGHVDTRYSDSDSTGFILDASLHLDYIEVPLVVMGIIPIDQKSEIRGYGGLSANFLVHSSLSGTLNSNFFEGDVENLSTIDWGALAGVSYEYRFPTVGIVMDVRYMGSIKSVEGSGDFDASVKLHAWSFALGLGIPLGKGKFY